MHRVRRQQRSFKKRWFTVKAKRGAVSSLLLTASTTPFLPSLGLWTPPSASHGPVTGFEDTTKTDSGLLSSKICAFGQTHGCRLPIRRARRVQDSEESPRRSPSPECGPARRHLRRCRDGLLRVLWKEGDEPEPLPVRPPTPPSPPRDDVDAYVAWNHERRTRELRKVEDFLIRRFSPHLLRPNEPVDEYLCSTLQEPILISTNPYIPRKYSPRPKKRASKAKPPNQNGPKQPRRKCKEAPPENAPSTNAQSVPTKDKKPVSQMHRIHTLLRHVGRKAVGNAPLVRSCSVFPITRAFILDEQRRLLYRRRRRVTRSLPSTARPPLRTLVEDPHPTAATSGSTKVASSVASTPSTAATRSPATTPRVTDTLDGFETTKTLAATKVPTSTSNSASMPVPPLVLKPALKPAKMTDTSTSHDENTLPPHTPKRVSFAPESLILKKLDRQNKMRYYAASRALSRQSRRSLDGLPARNHHSF